MDQSQKRVHTTSKAKSELSHVNIVGFITRRSRIEKAITQESGLQPCQKETDDPLSKMLDNSIQNEQVNLRQLLESELQILNMLFLRGVFLVRRSDSGIEFPKFLPSFVHAQRGIELQSPKLDSASENGGVILAQRIIGD